MSNFMYAATEIGDILDKKNACLDKASNIIAESCIDRAKEGKVTNNLLDDVMNLLDGFSESDKVTILAEAIVSLTKNVSGASKQTRQKTKAHADYFSSRGL